MINKLIAMKLIIKLLKNSFNTLIVNESEHVILELIAYEGSFERSDIYLVALSKF